MMSEEMTQENNIPKVYDPQSFEKKWYKFWEDNKLFHAEVDKSKKPYSMVIRRRMLRVSCTWGMRLTIRCRIF